MEADDPARGRVPLDRDRVGRALAAAGCPGPVRVVARTDSTQQRARLAAAGGVEEGWAILAEEQVSGRGRSGRGWWAPPRSAVLASMLWRPDRPPHRFPELSLVAGVAVAAALRDVGVLGVTLKWPNDCLLGGRKLAGILLEVVPGGPAPVPSALVVGVGCNVDTRAGEWPPELAGIATSCARPGARLDRTALAAAILCRLWLGYRRWLRDGSGWARAAWHDLDPSPGRRVVVQSPKGPVEGVILGLDPGGRLRLLTDRGERVLAVGEVHTLRPAVGIGSGPSALGTPQVIDDTTGGAYDGEVARGACWRA
ncbi:MAG TPA: biotin--[acetyl-CoA-carboxylase] ligase [Verrucomicrobiae bacterium]|nr:biotin--[acetyl-CoA-carboxylase] ligase [Verrucomicrobiae bacterium]